MNERRADATRVAWAVRRPRSRRPLGRGRLTAHGTLALLIATIAGCAAPKPAGPAATGAPAPQATADVTPVQPQPPPTPPPSLAEAARQAGAGPRDAAKAPRTFYQLEFYQLALPRGAISGNAAFWKPFDESFLGLWQHDVLAKNGLRVGRAPLVELKYIADQLADADQTKQEMIGAKGKDVEIGVKQNVAAQTLAYFDAEGRLQIRDYQHVDDLFAINFRQTPRQPDRVRLEIAPMVRDDQVRLEVADPITLRVNRVRGQTLYDLGVKVDLGVDECLVIAPDPAAGENQTLVGRTFLFDERPAQLIEKAIVIIPRVRGTLTEVPPPQADARQR